MGKIISINSFKGGSGKTTTTQTLAAALTMKGNRCLVIDLDPQANLSLASNIDFNNYSIYDLMNGDCNFDQAYQVKEYYDIIPADISLSEADQKFIETGKEYILHNILEPIRDQYDYILLDNAPSLGILTINSLIASDNVIIPMEQSYYALQSLEQLCNTIKDIQNEFNERLQIMGLLLVKYTEKAAINRFIMAWIERFVRDNKLHLFSTYIHESSMVFKAQIMRRNVIELDPNCRLAKDYKKLSDEVDPDYIANIKVI